MKTSKQIQAQIDERKTTVDAILAQVKEDDREPNQDEQTAVNAFYGTDDENVGEIGKLQAELKSALRREQIQDELKAAAKKELKPLLDDQMSANRPKVPATARRHGNLKAFRNSSEGEFDAFATGQWLLSAFSPKQEVKAQAAEWCRTNGFGPSNDIKAAMSTTAATLGLDLVPEPLEAAIIRIVEAWGVTRQFARPATMTSMTHKIPHRTGGLTVYYPDENSSITASDVTVDDVTLTAKSYATLTKISNRLNATSIISVVDELAIEIGLAFALAEDTNAFLGDGTSGFASVTGLESALNANSQVTGAGSTLASLTLANFESTLGKLLAYTGAMPCWFCNSAVYRGKMIPLANAAGGATGTEISLGYAKEMGYDGCFLGYPVKFTQAMPAAPATGKAAAFLGDLSQSVYMGTLQGIGIATSEHVYFTDDSLGIRGTEYCGITVDNQDSSVAGPVVGLYLA